MSGSVAPTAQVCRVPGCLKPRLVVRKLCECEEPDCAALHTQSMCCKRHSSNCAGFEFWLPNDGIVDDLAIDIVIHDERAVPVTWVEGLITSATLLALGYSGNELTRRLGFQVSDYPHGLLRGPVARRDIERAVMAIKGMPLPPLPAPPEPKPKPEVTASERLAQKAKTARQRRERRARLKAAAEKAAGEWRTS